MPQSKLETALPVLAGGQSFAGPRVKDWRTLHSARRRSERDRRLPDDPAELPPRVRLRDQRERRRHCRLGAGISVIIVPGRLHSPQTPEYLPMTHQKIRQICALLILAGGKSSRMGRPKAWLPFHGQPMLARVLDRLAPLFEERVVVRAPRQELPE